jgi:outer membrane receptor protein involved in Fe transport
MEHDARGPLPAGTRTAIACFAAVLALAVPPGVSAETDDRAAPAGGLEEIVVTATRRSERLQDVPVSATAFTQERLDAAGVRNIDDLARETPGLTFERNGTSAAGNFNDEDTDINIRGIDSSAGTSTVGIYVDDTPIQGRHITFTSFNAFPALFDLERVEVLRGPQGTLFGAGSEGGTIRFIQPTPDLHSYSAYMRSEVAGTENGDPSYELGAAAGGPLIDDRLGFRVSASYREDGGWVNREDYRTGQITEKDANYAQTIVVRAALKWAATDTLSVTPSVYYQELRLHDTSAYWGELSNPQAENFANGNAQRNPSTDPFSLAAVKLEWDAGFAVLTSNTSYFSRAQHSSEDYTEFDRTLFGLSNVGPRPPVGDLGTSFDTDAQNNFYQEVRLQSPDPAAALSWTAGFFYSHLDENTTERVVDPNLNAEFAAFYGSPLCTSQAPCPGGEILSQPVSRIIDQQYAAFGDATLRLSDAWKATLGLRVARTAYSGDLEFYGPFFAPTTGAAAPLVARGSDHEDPVTPKGVLTYQPDRNDLLYASVAKGYRVGGINPATSSLCGPNLASIGLSAPPASYASDSLWSYEVGAKNTLWGGHLQLNSSLFVINWKNIQQSVYLTECGQNFVENLGAVLSHGGDIEVQVKPLDALQLGLSVAYVDAKYTKTVCGGPSACSGPVAQSQPVVSAGDRLAGAPWTIVTSAEYAFGPLAGRTPYLHADYQLTTAQTALLPIQDPGNGVSDPTYQGLPRISTLAARAGLRFQGVDVSFFGQNLTDAHPLVFRTRDTTASDLYFSHTIRPRLLGITATYRY